MKPAWPMTLLLAALLAGCSAGPTGDSSSTTTSQEPEPTLQWVSVNRTLSISGTNTGGGAFGTGFEAAPGNANCAYFHHIGEAGLTTLVVDAQGPNPQTVAAWDLIAHAPFGPNTLQFESVTGRLPLTLNLTDLDTEGKRDLQIWLETARSSPGSTAIQSPATLNIRLGMRNPSALVVEERAWSCTT